MDSKLQKTSYLLNIPNEITVEILGHIKIEDICSISLANRKFYKLLQDDYTWRLMCRNEYPQSRILEAQNDLAEDEALKQAFTTIRNSEQDEDDSIFKSLSDNLSENDVLSTSNCHIGSSTDVPSATAVAKRTEHNELEWLTLYKYLSNPISYVAKEKGVIWLDCSDGPYNSNHWETETGESDYGKIVHLNYVWWFDVRAKLKCVQPGTYDVIWRLKVDDEHIGLECLDFTTQVLSNGYETLDVQETIVQEKNYVSNSKLFENISSEGTWVEYCLPYQIVVPEEGIIDGEYIWYDVMCKIYEHGSYKRGLSIDCVKLRYHKDGSDTAALKENAIPDRQSLSAKILGKLNEFMTNLTV